MNDKALVSEEQVELAARALCAHEGWLPDELTHRYLDSVESEVPLWHIKADEARTAPQAALGVGGWRPMDAAWFQGIPQEPGIYRVTGWCLDDLTRIAVVQVEWDSSHLELVHNLHRETSCEPEEFRTFRNMSREFWWQRVDLAPLPPPPSSEEG